MSETIHVIDPIKNLTLSMGGKKVQIAAGRLDYYSGDQGAFVTIRPNDSSVEPLTLSVAPADKGRRIFGRSGSLRLMGPATAALDPEAIDPGVMSWTQVCSCNADRLKKELMALEPVWSEPDLTAMGLA